MVNSLYVQANHAPLAAVNAYDWEDPDPPGEGANQEAIESHAKELVSHSRVLRDYYKDLDAEDLWSDMRFAIRPENWAFLHKVSRSNTGGDDKLELKKWRDLVQGKGLSLPTMAQTTPIWVRLNHLFHRTLVFPGATTRNPVSFLQIAGHDSSPSGPGLVESDAPSNNAPANGRSTAIMPAVDRHGQPSSSRPHQSGTASNALSTESSRVDSHRLSSLSKLLIGREKFTGTLDQDISMVFGTYETLASCAGLEESEMVGALALIVEGTPLRFYRESVRGKTNSWADAKSLMFHRFTSEEQRHRLLREWQQTSLTTYLKAAKPDESERDVYVRMATRLRSIQGLLDKNYQEDRFLRDQIQLACDLEKISEAFKLKAASTSLEAEERAAAFLSTEPGSALEQGAKVFYGRDTRFTGAARKSPFTRRFPAQRYRARGTRKFRGSCFVCGKNHRARDGGHSEEEVARAMEQRGFSKSESANMAVALLSTEDSEGGEVEAAVADVEVEEGGSVADEDPEVNYMEADVARLHFHQDQAFLAHLTVDHHIPQDNSSDDSHTAGGKVPVSSYMADYHTSIQKMNEELRKAEDFRGVLLDSGCNKSSLISAGQLKAYTKEFGVMPVIKTGRSRHISGFSKGSRVSSIGTVTLPIPFPGLGISAEVEFHVTEEDHITLLSYKDMKRLGIVLDTHNDCVKLFDRTQRLCHLSAENYQPIIRFTEDDFDSFCAYTFEELHKMHRALGHPSVKKLADLLERADPEKKSDVRKMLQELTEDCETCQMNESPPRRFKISCRLEDDIRFSAEVEVDIMYIRGMPVLHIICPQTHYQAAGFLKNVSAEEVWRTLVRIWLHSYTGPPDILRVDQGKQFVSKRFMDEADNAGIKVIQAPIECPTSISTVERYHAPLRAAFEKISETETDKEAALQHAVFSVNSTVGPEGLVPMLLVFGTTPKPARRVPSKTQLMRAQAVEEARIQLEKLYAQAKVKAGLKYKGPYASERQDLGELRTGDSVRVYRPHDKAWKQYKFVSQEGESVVVQGDSGRKVFRSTVVRPLAKKGEIIDGTVLKALFGEDAPDMAMLSSDSNEEWSDSRAKEVEGLLKGKVLKKVKRTEARAGVERIYGCRFVDTQKANGERKSRLVAQNYRDAAARSIPTRSPTLSRATQRFLLSMGASSLASGRRVAFRDVQQAYTQSKYRLGRRVFLDVPPNLRGLLGMEDDEVLLCLKPLYGVPESGLLWFLTISEHYSENLGMEQSHVDRCLFVRKDEDLSSCDLVGIQVDDSILVGSDQFMEDEQTHASEFRCKPRVILADGERYTFNGVEIRRDGCDLVATQTEKIGKLCPPKTEDELVSVRAAVQYISSCTRPDVSAPAQLLASEVRAPEARTWKDMNLLISFLQETSTEELRFVPLRLDKLELTVFTDAAFANAENSKSQLGYVIVLTDGERCNVVDWGSARSSRVTRSVLAAELFALVLGFDRAYCLSEMLRLALGRRVEISEVTDSQTAFNTVARLSTTLERRLQIDVHGLQESHRIGELTKLIWTRREFNASDPMTHRQVQKESALRRILRTNSLQLPETGTSFRVKKHVDLGGVD